MWRVREGRLGEEGGEKMREENIKRMKERREGEEKRKLS